MDCIGLLSFPNERLERLGLAKPLCICPTAKRPEVVRPFWWLCVWYQPPVRCEDRRALRSPLMDASARAAFEGSDVTFCAFRLWDCDRAAAQVVPYIGAVVPADRP